MDWTDQQIDIILSPPATRMLVEAGPGTGKTAVACGRIAWLLEEEGLLANEIWLITFTRTAVAELRNRIGSFLQNPKASNSIRIATIDSHAWAIQSGFNQDASLAGGYEKNIRQVIDLVRRHEGVFDYLSRLRHLVIDEAQDVIGSRMELLMEIIHALPDECGVTVFCDGAQAIYGFAEDEDQDPACCLSGTLPSNVRQFMGDSFSETVLTENHRMKDDTLRELSEKGRKLLLSADDNASDVYRGLKKLVKETNHGKLKPFGNRMGTCADGSDDIFLLFRRRAGALMASSYFGTAPHRLRMSGLPKCIPDWIARIFWDHRESEIGRDDFDGLWKERIHAEQHEAMAQAWEKLVRLAGKSDTRVSMEQLATRLSGSSIPDEMVMPDFGLSGPLLGTIHGAKGRESDTVCIYLPPSPSEETDAESLMEEARVLFVGATRARKKLMVGTENGGYIRTLGDGGRTYAPLLYRINASCAMVEFGHDGDIHPEGLVGKKLFNEESALQAQERLSGLSGSTSKATAKLVPHNTGWGTSWHYAVYGDRWNLGALFNLSEGVNSDLFEIGRMVDEETGQGRSKPPLELKHLRIFGTRTVAVDPDDPARSSLLYPWSESGFMIAPLLVGYELIYFRR